MHKIKWTLNCWTFLIFRLRHLIFFMHGFWTHLLSTELNRKDWRIACMQNWILAYAHCMQCESLKFLYLYADWGDWTEREITKSIKREWKKPRSGREWKCLSCLKLTINGNQSPSLLYYWTYVQRFDTLLKCFHASLLHNISETQFFLLHQVYVTATVTLQIKKCHALC